VLGLGLQINKSSFIPVMPRDVNGNVLSLIAKQGNNGQIPNSGTKIWSDRSKVRTQYSYSNLVSNGDFSDASAWNSVLSAISLSGGILTLLASAQNGRLRSGSIPRIIGRKYYIASKVKASSNLVSLHSYGSAISGTTHQGNNEYGILKAIFTAPDSDPNWSVGVIDARTSGWTDVFIDWAMVIDLTALGLDTLSVEQCDALFNFTAVTNTATTPITQVKYNPLDWTQWNIPAVGVTRDNTGLELTSDSSIARYSYILSSFKPSTKYGLLYNVVNSNINGSFAIDLNYWVFDANGNLGKTVGNQKFVATSKSSITGNNALYIAVSTNNTTGLKIKLKDIRVFELPTGSQVESDFTNLTADQLNTLYPMGVNEVVTARANDCLMVNQAGNGASGFNSEVNPVTGKTIWFNRLDGTDDYGAFANTPSLDITTGEFALACTFRVASDIVSITSYLISKNLSDSTTSQYALAYVTSGRLDLYLNGTNVMSLIGLIERNVWYNVVFYRNNSGVIKSYINKVEKTNATYSNVLTSQPNIRLGVRSNNVGGTAISNYFKGDVATQSIYQAPTLDINRVIKAEMEISFPYTNIK